MGHYEQFLFSCVSSKVNVCHAVTCHISNANVDHWDMLIAEQLLFSRLCIDMKTKVEYTQNSLFIGENGNAFLQH